MENKVGLNTAQKLALNIEHKNREADLRLRKSNVVWTVSGDYSFRPVLNLFDSYGDYDMDFYRMMLLGYCYSKLDMMQVMEFIAIHIEKTDYKNEFLKFVEIFIDDCYCGELVKERPGAENYRKIFRQKILAKYGVKSQEKNDLKSFNEIQDLKLEQQMEYIYYTHMGGMYFNFETGMTDLCIFAHRKRKAYDTDGFIKVLNEIFLKYFFINTRYDANTEREKRIFEQAGESKKQDDLKKPEKPRLQFRMRKKSLDELRDGDYIGTVSVESAEFTKDISEYEQIDDDRIERSVKPSIARSNEKIKDMISARYGSSMYSPHVTETLERELCTGIHSGIKIHFTEGKFTGSGYDRYFSQAIERQRMENMDYYNDNELTFRRAVNELKSILSRKLNLEDEEESGFSYSGKLVVDRIWRNRVFGEEKIFKKTDKNNPGSISVDILLDSSASQREREPMVSSQAYIIAEALTSLNIPTRVVGFCNFFNFLVMTQYRDYMDGRMANKNIFSYNASGSNRDGLAIKTVSAQMDTTEYEKKVLIVLSDGKPNDKVDIGTIGFFEIDGENYENEDAVKDTAQEVFNMKLRGKYPLGVFTGLDDDLDQEKMIYGKDFAYIRDIERFSQVIGFYLENILVWK